MFYIHYTREKVLKIEMRKLKLFLGSEIVSFSFAVLILVFSGFFFLFLKIFFFYKYEPQTLKACVQMGLGNVADGVEDSPAVPQESTT